MAAIFFVCVIFSFPFFPFTNNINVCSPDPRVEPLSAPQPPFKRDSYTFSNCLLLHKLLITNQVAHRYAINLCSWDVEIV